MPTEQLIGGKFRDVAWSERRDSGGMFDATVGVYCDDSGYVAYVTDWGRGIKSPPHPTLEDAKADIERLWNRMY